jgi:hypothetical protein
LIDRFLMRRRMKRLRFPIDPTGMLYALLNEDADIEQTLRSYLPFQHCVFFGYQVPEQRLGFNDLGAALKKRELKGMTRVPNGFIYVLDDSAIVLGFDGQTVGTSELRRLEKDVHIQALLTWGDQPPPETRRDFLSHFS